MAKSKPGLAKPDGPTGQPTEDELKARVVERSMAMSFSGPLPPPHLLAQYNEMIPNGAERILAMAERQSVHREELEASVVKANIAAQTRGSYFAFILGFVALAGGMLLIYIGKSVSGLVAIISAMTGLGSVFVYSKIEQRRERVEKAAALQARKRRD